MKMILLSVAVLLFSLLHSGCTNSQQVVANKPVKPAHVSKSKTPVALCNEKKLLMVPSQENPTSSDMAAMVQNLRRVAKKGALPPSVVNELKCFMK